MTIAAAAAAAAAALRLAGACTATTPLGYTRRMSSLQTAGGTMPQVSHAVACSKKC
jgi:hypothetical protein